MGVKSVTAFDLEKRQCSVLCDNLIKTYEKLRKPHGFSAADGALSSPPRLCGPSSCRGSCLPFPPAPTSLGGFARDTNEPPESLCLSRHPPLPRSLGKFLPLC